MNGAVMEAGGVPGTPGGRRIIQAWLLCAVIDGAWAVVLTSIYQRSIVGLFQGIAATAFGPTMLDGGARSALLGVAIHFAVALFWSGVFFALVAGSAHLRRAVSTAAGVVLAAAVYGPLVWIVMSAGVIPMLTGQPLDVTPRWWIQLVGHIAFVGLPIVWGIGRPERAVPMR